MTQWIDATDVPFERSDLTRRIVSQVAPGAIAVGLAVALGAWLFYVRPPDAAKAPNLVSAVKHDAQVFGALSVPLPAPSPALSHASNPYGDLVVAGFEPEPSFAVAERESTTDVPVPPAAPSRADAEVVAPLPPHRPAEFSGSHASEPAPAVADLEPPPRPTTHAARPEKPAAPDERSVIEKLFGLPHAAQPAPSARTSQPALAYAAPETNVARSAATPSGRGGSLLDVLRGASFGSSSSPAARYGSGVAVYDISAHVVYLPDGTKLEAHSGLGDRLDDPRSVSERMRGATPPATYSLTPREALFHGVPALRLTPIEGNVFGRAGLLAHTYMLGPNGDSNGCISFRDYDAFLRAYQNGQVRKLVVVSSL